MKEETLSERIHQDRLGLNKLLDAHNQHMSDIYQEHERKEKEVLQGAEEWVLACRRKYRRIQEAQARNGQP